MRNVDLPFLASFLFVVPIESQKKNKGTSKYSRESEREASQRHFTKFFDWRFLSSVSFLFFSLLLISQLLIAPGSSEYGTLHQGEHAAACFLIDLDSETDFRKFSDSPYPTSADSDWQDCEDHSLSSYSICGTRADKNALHLVIISIRSSLVSSVRNCSRLHS